MPPDMPVLPTNTVPPPMPTNTPEPTPTDTPSPARHEFSVDDPTEGSSPDFRRLTIVYDDTVIYVTILFNSEADVPNASHFVYLYGTHHHMIRFDPSSFELRMTQAWTDTLKS